MSLLAFDTPMAAKALREAGFEETQPKPSVARANRALKDEPGIADGPTVRRTSTCLIRRRSLSLLFGKSAFYRGLAVLGQDQ